MDSIRQVIKRFIPGKYRPKIKSVFYFGSKVQCPCCEGHFRKFMPLFGRSNAICPVCGSLERHRLIWLYLKNETSLFSKSVSLLHFAPEDVFSEKFSSLSNVFYVSAGLTSRRAMINADMTSIPHKDDTFDVVLCSHVLEHIEDDRRAMRELFRVLKHNGYAILQHPIDQKRDVTFEDPSVVTLKDRTKMFGQEDHVRIYGRDLKHRLEEAGFSVDVEDYAIQFNPKMIQRYGLNKENQIYICQALKAGR